MAKFISLKFEPETGTAFDYLVNVGDILNIDIQQNLLLLSCGATLSDFPLDVEGATAADTENMYGFIRDLLLAAKQRPGNAYIVAAEDGPVTITDFS